MTPAQFSLPISAISTLKPTTAALSSRRGEEIGSAALAAANASNIATATEGKSGGRSRSPMVDIVTYEDQKASLLRMLKQELANGQPPG